MSEGIPRSMAAAAGVLLVVVLAGWLYAARQRQLRAKDQVDVSIEMAARVEQQDPVLFDSDFGPDWWDPDLHAHLQEVARAVSPGIDTCRGFWPEAPPEVLVHIRTDVAGRLVGLSVQGAPQRAAECLLEVLGRGRWLRNADGVARLKLRF